MNNSSHTATAPGDSISHTAALVIAMGVALLLLLTSACSTSPTGPNTTEPRTTGSSEWNAQQARLDAMASWQANGKIALRSATASESARINWLQSDNNSQIKLNGPLGIGAMSISSDGQTLVVEQGKAYRTLDISTPEAIFTNTGWQLPLQALPYWLKGIPSPDYAVDEVVFTENGDNIEQLQQDGWRISYNRYSSFESLTLPTLLVAERDDMRLKLVLQQWSNLAQE